MIATSEWGSKIVRRGIVPLPKSSISNTCMGHMSCLHIHDTQDTQDTQRVWTRAMEMDMLKTDSRYTLYCITYHKLLGIAAGQFIGQNDFCRNEKRGVSFNTKAQLMSNGGSNTYQAGDDMWRWRLDWTWCDLCQCLCDNEPRGGHVALMWSDKSDRVSWGSRRREREIQVQQCSGKSNRSSSGSIHSPGLRFTRGISPTTGVTGACKWQYRPHVN